MSSCEASRLLDWFDRQKRSMPWRGETDPYRILVSEIMLQQTRVEVVQTRYADFLEQFPDVERLAAASEDEVVAAWSGLGYYRRARALRACARAVRDRGGFPRTARELRALPGIGEYTAAAVASIAFAETLPTLDGNVERVLTRRLREKRNPKRAAPRRELAARAAALLDPARPGDSNQALMELGATICTPRKPKCSNCPLRSGCQARQCGDQESFPALRRKVRTERIELTQLVARDERGRVLLERRARDADYLAGFWELPTYEGSFDAQRVRRLAMERGLELVGTTSTPVRFHHAITFRRFEIWATSSDVRGGSGAVDGAGREAKWVSTSQLDAIAHSSMVRKALATTASAASLNL